MKFIDKHLQSQQKQQAQSEVAAAVRQFESVRSGDCRGSEWLGWYQYPKRQGFEELKQIQAFKDALRVPYDSIFLIGVGGSYLGTRAVEHALGHPYAAQLQGRGADLPKPIYYCGHHLSERAMMEIMDVFAHSQPLVVVASKSGTTTEPAVAFRLLRSALEKRLGKEEAQQRIIAITDPEKGALKQLSLTQGYKTFDIPADVGGRFSVLTPIGMLPLALAGYDVDGLMRGADAVYQSLEDMAEAGELAQHPVIRYAASRFGLYQSGIRTEFLASFEPKLHYVMEWWKQLFGESEGKNHQGLLPCNLVYTTDLHSMGQYVQQGPRQMAESFLTVADATSASSGGMERRLRVPASVDNTDQLSYLEGRTLFEVNHWAEVGTAMAHVDGGIGCMELQMASLDAANLGQTFAFFQAACAVSALLLGQNPFDQPGVEEYKTNLFGLLSKPGFEQLGQRLRQRMEASAPAAEQ